MKIPKNPTDMKAKCSIRAERQRVFLVYPLYKPVHMHALTITFHSSLVTVNDFHHLSQRCWCPTVWSNKLDVSEKTLNRIFTSILLISRHTPCSDAPQKTKSIKESIPEPWGTEISRCCKQERLNKESWNELNAAKSKVVCNERWYQRRIWTFEQERRRRLDSEITPMLCRQAGPPATPHAQNGSRVRLGAGEP